MFIVAQKIISIERKKFIIHAVTDNSQQINGILGSILVFFIIISILESTTCTRAFLYSNLSVYIFLNGLIRLGRIAAERKLYMIDRQNMKLFSA